MAKTTVNVSRRIYSQTLSGSMLHLLSAGDGRLRISATSQCRFDEPCANCILRYTARRRNKKMPHSKAMIYKKKCRWLFAATQLFIHGQ